MPNPNTHPEPDWVDVVGHMQYLREAYHAEVDLAVSVGTDGTENAMLCVSVLAWCRRPGHEPVLAASAGALSTASLSRLPAVVLDRLFELHEELDGGCVQCREAVN